MNKNSIIVTTLVTLIIAGCSGFFAGMKYQQSKASSFSAGQATFRTGTNIQVNRGNTQPHQVGRMGMRGGGGVNGEITSVDGQSITVKASDGSSKIVILSGSTNINKAATASKTDLNKGVKVAVFGGINSDGSISAQNIQINPLMRPNNAPLPSPGQ